MDLKQLNDLDLSTIGEWPASAKAVLILFLCLVLAGVWYWFLTQAQLDHLGRLQAEEVELRASFEIRQRQAANLLAYRHQLGQIEEALAGLLRRLPGSAEIAALLVDVSHTGLAAGLEFDLFRPEEEQSKNFYAELPIKVEVTGHYHDFGRFVSGLAALPRIVTVQDVVINTLDKGGADPGAAGKLRLGATVKTYRYLEEEPAKEAATNKGKTTAKREVAE